MGMGWGDTDLAFENSPRATDDDLRRLENLSELKTLRLTMAAITDKGAGHLSKLTGLRDWSK
jgi:hypothetical protein